MSKISQELNNQLINTQKEIHKKISKNNNDELTYTSRLRTISFNLKIEESKLNIPNGLKPTIKELQNIIIELHDSTEELVNKDRANLQEVSRTIYENLEYSTNLIIAYSNYINYITSDNNIEHDIINILEFDEEDIKTWLNKK